MTESDRLGRIRWPEATVLITGGTGSLGRSLTRLLLRRYKPKGLRIFSRDEWLGACSAAGLRATAVPFEHSEVPPGTTEVFVGTR